jgi:hemerythrin-like domain-containing protein
VKRSEALAGLSRDHHQALFAAMRLKRATPDDAAQASAGFREYFERTGDRHFDAEETVLLPALPDEGDWAGLAARVRAEHRELRAAGARLAAGEDVDVGELHAFGAALEAHVRFEERELFPFLEQRLAEAELAELGRRLENDRF